MHRGLGRHCNVLKDLSLIHFIHACWVLERVSVGIRCGSWLILGRIKLVQVVSCCVQVLNHGIVPVLIRICLLLLPIRIISAGDSRSSWYYRTCQRNRLVLLIMRIIHIVGLLLICSSYHGICIHPSFLSVVVIMTSILRFIQFGRNNISFLCHTWVLIFQLIDVCLQLHLISLLGWYLLALIVHFQSLFPSIHVMQCIHVLSYL